MANEIEVVYEAPLHVEPIVIERAPFVAEHVCGAVEGEFGQDAVASAPIRDQDTVRHQSPLKDDEHNLVNASFTWIVRAETQLRVPQVLHLPQVIVLKVRAVLLVALQAVVIVRLRVRIVMKYQLLQVVYHLFTVEFEFYDRRRLLD